MNFYPHHISDFNNATRHLTRVERSVYRDAIELYYDTESVLTGDISRLEKKLICRSEEEKQALIDVLDEFFELNDDGYFHERCDIEITKYRANITAKAKAGIASAAARKKKAAERKQKSTRVKSSSTAVHNQEPITNNQEPRIKEKEHAHSALAEKLGVDTDLIDCVVKHRRDIKSPANTDKKITIVINDFKSCVERGLCVDLNAAMDRLDKTEWKTLKPEYIDKSRNNNEQNRKPSNGGTSGHRAIFDAARNEGVGTAF